MSRFLSARFAALEAYVPGEQPQDILCEAEHQRVPLPPSPEVIAAVSAGEAERLNLYPTRRAGLRKKLADLYQWGRRTCSSPTGPTTFSTFLHGLLRPERPWPSRHQLRFLPVFAQLYNLPATVIPLGENFTLNPEDYCGSIRTSSSPTQTPPRAWPSPWRISRGSCSNPATWWSSTRPMWTLGRELPPDPAVRQPAGVQTFSKSRSMAGARLGFALGSAGLIGT